MSVSRRRLLQNTVFAALAGLARPIYSWTGNNKNSAGAAPQQPSINNNLNHITRHQFTEVVGSSFRVTEDGKNFSPVYLRLVAVQDLPRFATVNTGSMAVPPPKTTSSTKTDGFVLIFTASLPKPLPQNTYEFEHAELGTFSLFIAPGGAGFQSYNAVINRLV
jgi:hypothetical protein